MRKKNHQCDIKQVHTYQSTNYTPDNTYTHTHISVHTHTLCLSLTEQSFHIHNTYIKHTEANSCLHTQACTHTHTHTHAHGPNACFPHTYTHMHTHSPVFALYVVCVNDAINLLLYEITFNRMTAWQHSTLKWPTHDLFNV